MPYTPNIPDYKPFYIQCEDDASAKNTATEWGLVAKTNPYPALPDPKEPYKNDFADEDGEEEAISTAEIRFWDEALTADQAQKLGTAGE